MTTLLYNNSENNVTVTLSNGTVTVESQPVGWAIEKNFILSNIKYESKTV
jgi:hypothetical protein